MGSYLRSSRALIGISLSSLAEKIRVTKGYLSRLENGKDKPSTALLKKISCVLKIDPNSLYLLAGYLPNDIKNIFYSYPERALEILRDNFGQFSVDDEVNKNIMTSTDTPKNVYDKMYRIINADCFRWMEQQPMNSIHAIVTDPPYGLKEYSPKETSKLRSGKGGVWRKPPNYDGCIRSSLPRFAILTDEDKNALEKFFLKWAKQALRILVPGGHIIIATNPLVSQYVYISLVNAGFEKRGEI